MVRSILTSLISVSLQTTYFGLGKRTRPLVCSQSKLISRQILQTYVAGLLGLYCPQTGKETQRWNILSQFWCQRDLSRCQRVMIERLNSYPTAFPYGNGMVLHFYQQQESSTAKTVHKVINKGLKTYV